MVFNRFKVEVEEPFRIIHFGNVDERGFLRDSFSAAISFLDLENQRQSFTSYFESFPSLSDFVPWDIQRVENPIEAFNLMGMGYVGLLAETILHNYSSKALHDVAGGKGEDFKMQADPIALLRCNASLQQHLIRVLFNL